MNKVDSVRLTKYILARVGPSTQLKLQKLAYYVDAWHLAYFEQPIIEEDFEAWIHGPVLRSVWNYFKAAGSVSLFQKFYIKDDVSDKFIQSFETEISQDQKEMIDNVLDEYGDKSAYYLETLSHSEKPWIEARGTCANSERCANAISKDTMKRFYQAKIA